MKINKRGISLIVLVITIIVMIILATAIILSLNSSNISGKASEAKLASDLASKKEAASVYLSEYEIKKAKGKITSTTSADAYVKSECKKAGIDTSDVLITEDGNILVGIAALFVNNNVKVGTEVRGYKLNNVTKYVTSGNENTCDATTSKETDPQPDSNITRDDEIKWQYFGIDEDGNALIAGSVSAETSPKMTLGGKGGYLYGPQELNKACEAMYSSTMGRARSIDINDVTRILDYTGEKSCYWDFSGTNRKIQTPKTISEIAKEIGYDMSTFSKRTPDGKGNIGEYKIDYYPIAKSDVEKKYNSDNIEFIYPDTTNPDSKLTENYWLSSSCVTASFGYHKAQFLIRYVAYVRTIFYETMCDSVTTSKSVEHAIRPVVRLNSNLSMEYKNGIVTLK